MDRGNPQSWNRYVYASNDPLRNVDPSGRNDMSVAGAPPSFGGGGWFNECNLDGSSNICGLLGGNSMAACPGNVCDGFTKDGQYVQFVAGAGGAQGFVPFSAITQGMYEENGTFMSDTQYDAYMAATFSSQITGQYNRLSGFLNLLFGGTVSADPNDPDVVGGHANFALDCVDGPCPGVGRYDNGVHIECASGGYNCAAGSPLVVHDDTVSPWITPFTFSNFNPLNFLEHGFVDLVGGTFCNCAFSQ